MPSGFCFSSGVFPCVCAQWESRRSRAASRRRAEGDHHVLAATRRNGTCECLWRLCSIALTWNHVTKGGNHVSEPHEDYRRFQFDASPPGARRGVLCARRTKGTRLVLLGRVAAFGITCNMVVAIGMIHRHIGFFANWSGQQKGEGYEYHLLAIAIALSIMIKGSGAFSADGALSRSRA